MGNSEKCLLFAVQTYAELQSISNKYESLILWVLNTKSRWRTYNLPQPTSVRNINLTQDTFKIFEEQMNHSCYAQVNSPKRGCNSAMSFQVMDRSACV